MPIKEDMQVTLQDLRAIIHSLRMAGLSSVDNDAVDEIKNMIKNLPEPEQLLGAALSPGTIKKIQEDVGRIMRSIEIYSKRGGEYKARYKSRTGLPPRYKVLEWRDVMKRENREIVKTLLKASSAVDKKGNSKIAKGLLVCAKSAKEDKIVTEDIRSICSDMEREGLSDESNMLKEAAWWQGVGQAFQGIKEQYNLGNIKGDMANIVNAIDKAMQKIEKKIQGIKDTATSQKVEEIYRLMDYMKGIGTKAYQVLDVTEEKVDQPQEEATGVKQVEQATEQELRAVLNQIGNPSLIPPPGASQQDLAKAVREQIAPSSLRGFNLSRVNKIKIRKNS